MSDIDLTPENLKFIEKLILSRKVNSMGQAINLAVDLLKQKVGMAEAVQFGLDQADRGDLVSGDLVFERLEGRASEIEQRD